MGLKYVYFVDGSASILLLKSDQNGVEIHLKKLASQQSQKLKSDQNGVEIANTFAFTGLMYFIKIRPKWG